MASPGYRRRSRRRQTNQRFMYWRGKLPHWVPEMTIVFVTWNWKVRRQTRERTNHERRPATTCWRPKLARRSRIAQIVVDAIDYGEQTGRDDLLAWAVMPNHVHLVILPRQPSSKAMNWLKSATANRRTKYSDGPDSRFGCGSTTTDGCEPMRRSALVQRCRRQVRPPAWRDRTESDFGMPWGVCSHGSAAALYGPSINRDSSARQVWLQEGNRTLARPSWHSSRSDSVKLANLGGRAPNGRRVR